MSIPDYVLVHTCTPMRNPETQSSPATWIEGEPGPETTPGAATAGTPFPCVLFLPTPGGTQPNAYRIRQVRTPTLLFNAYQDDDVTPNVIGHEDEVLISAPELAAWLGGQNPVRWLVSGEPRPFGPPGDVIGLEATLERVED